MNWVALSTTDQEVECQRKLDNSPRRSAHRLSKETGISYTATRLFWGFWKKIRRGFRIKCSWSRYSRRPTSSSGLNLRMSCRATVFPWFKPFRFFLCGHLKTLVYKDPTPTTVDELKKKIRDEIRKLNRNKEMFAAVYDNFLVRIQQLYSKKGDYMEHVLNY